MKSKFDALPTECQKCINLRCGHVYMNREGSYTCAKVICFWKNKETQCKDFEEYIEI